MGATVSMLLLAAAVSLDSFSTGFAYGLRNIRIPTKSIFIISLCSAVSLAGALSLGRFIEGFLSREWADRIGGMILVAIGAWVLYQFFRPEKEHPIAKDVHMFKWEIKSLGIVIHILKTPTKADMDRSGSINGMEAILLGIALSLDAFGAGIGAGMLGYSPYWLSAAVIAMCFLFLASGMRAGMLFSHIGWMQKLSFLPGVILMLIGILKM